MRLAKCILGEASTLECSIKTVKEIGNMNDLKREDNEVVVSKNQFERKPIRIYKNPHEKVSVLLFRGVTFNIQNRHKEGDLFQGKRDIEYHK